MGLDGSDAQGPLHGVRVLDFTQNLPGPYATLLLAQLGAEVVKVEPPRGDPARHLGPMFELLNRGKRGIVLDLRTDEGQADALELVRWCHVLVEGFRPGVMDRLGVGVDACRSANPRLIYCSVSAHGQHGPRATDPGHDLNLQALAGLCHLERGADGPRGTVLPIADFSTSLSATTAICAALASERRGFQHLDIAMRDAVQDWTQIWNTGIDPIGSATRAAPRPMKRALRRLRRWGPVDTIDRKKLYNLPHYGLFKTRDRRWLALGIVDENHFWRALCATLGLKPLAGLKLPARAALGPVLRAVVAARFRTRTRADWLASLRAAGVPATAVLDGEGSRNSALADGAIRPPLPGAAMITRPAPDLGEHTQTVLASCRDAATTRSLA